MQLNTAFFHELLRAMTCSNMTDIYDRAVLITISFICQNCSELYVCKVFGNGV